MILIISNIFSFAQHKNTKMNEGIVTIKKKQLNFIPNVHHTNKLWSLKIIVCINIFCHN